MGLQSETALVVAGATADGYAHGYRAPKLPKNAIQNLIDAGFEYHLPASNEMGYWTHPSLCRFWLSTQEALAQLMG